MTIKRVKEIIDDLSNKEQLGYLSGAEFNNLFRISELSHFNFLLGNPTQYSPGRPVPRVGLGMTKAIDERLAPFRVTIEYNIFGDDSKFDKPVDLVAIEAINGDDGTPICPVTHAALGRLLKSSVWDLRENPVYCDYDTYIQVFHPDLSDASFGFITITGITTPPESIWAYTVDGDIETYSPTGSIDPWWLDSDIYRIIGIMCKHVGIKLQDGVLMQSGQSIINQGE